MTRVLIVDDSPSACRLLAEILAEDPDIKIAGIAADGKQAIEMIGTTKPDVITMDIYMPGMDGFEATRRILEIAPIPIVIISSCYATSEVEKTFQAIGAGAVAILPKPRITDTAFQEASDEIVRTVKLMSEVKVVTRRADYRKKGASVPGTPESPEMSSRIRPVQGFRTKLQIVAIGASTGGPPALQEILYGLPPQFPLPVLIVQHISPGFLPGMIEWLSQTSGLPLSIAKHGEKALPGHGYFAPDGHHLGIDGSCHIRISNAPPEGSVRPSVSYLFRSVLHAFRNTAAAVLLTGMGRDGAAELKSLFTAGALTIAQDEESSVVFGMPGEAVRIGAAKYVLPPEKIADVLCLSVSPDAFP